MSWWLHPVANARCEADIAVAEAYDDGSPGGYDDDPSTTAAVAALSRRVYWETLVLGPRGVRLLDWLRDRNRRRVLGLF